VNGSRDKSTPPLPGQRIVLAGGSGYLGRLLSRHFAGQGSDVVILTRSPVSGGDAARQVAWDGRRPGEWARELEGAHAVINLAGRSVNCRYHARNRRLILDSRVNATSALGEAIARGAKPPRVWLNSSTATIYRHTFGPAWTESGEIGCSVQAKDQFSVQVARAWEAAFDEAPTPWTRKVAMRTAMVLGAGRNSVLPVLLRLVRCGLGGRLAGGAQFVSWIHETDFCRAVQWLIERDDISGPVNLAAPGPVPNAELMRALRRACGFRVGLPAPRWLLEAGAFLLRTETELIIKSRCVVPGRLISAGFHFRHPTLSSAVKDLLRQTPV
jgi:uncharacterized protein (TIGR01777 family)